MANPLKSRPAFAESSQGDSPALDASHINQSFIAREAKVSQKTVSCFFRDRGRVAPETCSRIEAVVKKYNYFPNAAALSIRYNKFNRIACVVAQFSENNEGTHPHLIAYINSISSELAKHAYSLVFEPVFIDKHTRRVDFPEFFSTRSVDGIIGIPGSWMPPEIDERIAALKLPTLWINRFGDGADYKSIIVDEAAGAEALARHLLRQGVRSVLWFGPDFSHKEISHYSVKIRCETLKEVLEAGGAKLTTVFHHPDENLSGQADRIVPSLSGHDAVVCYNFHCREAIVWAAIRAGVDLLPLRLSYFASFDEAHVDNPSRCDYVLIPETEIGRRAARFMIRSLAGEVDEDLLAPVAGKLCVGAADAGSLNGAAARTETDFPRETTRGSLHGKGKRK